MRQEGDNALIELITCSAAGSVNVDAALRPAYPNDPRWDYGVGLERQGAEYRRVVWVEVHPASSDSVGKVIEKVKWLRGWLKDHGGALRRLTQAGDSYWLSPSGVKIRPGSPQARQLAAENVQGPLERLRV